MPDITSSLFSSIINAVMGFWYIIPLLLIIAFFKSPYFKGRMGEAFVNSTINRKLDKTQYHLIKDATLPTADGTMQVDHIIVSQYGIFVIETKNMKGWIFGGEKQKMWTQQIYKHKNKFQNPLHQNYKHTKTLEHLLDLSNDKFHSIIIFTGEATFKTKMPENVLKRGFTDYIKSKNSIVFSENEVAGFIQQIGSSRYDRDYKTNRDHVKHLKQNRAKTRKEPSY